MIVGWNPFSWIADLTGAGRSWEKVEGSFEPDAPPPWCAATTPRPRRLLKLPRPEQILGWDYPVAGSRIATSLDRCAGCGWSLTRRVSAVSRA